MQCLKPMVILPFRQSPMWLKNLQMKNEINRRDWNVNFTFHIHLLGNRCPNSKNKKFQIYCYNILPIDSDDLFPRTLNEELCTHWNMVCKVGWAPWNLSCFEFKFDDTTDFPHNTRTRLARLNFFLLLHDIALCPLWLF